MNDLLRLKEAVQRYTTESYPDRSARGWDYLSDATDIADALTNPSPITRERLEAMGFDNAAVAGDAGRWILHVGDYAVHANKLEYSGWFFQASPIPDGYVFKLFPQPQTMGDLAVLLLRLSREEKAVE